MRSDLFLAFSKDNISGRWLAHVDRDGPEKRQKGEEREGGGGEEKAKVKVKVYVGRREG